MKGLFHHIVHVLNVEGPMTFERLATRCTDPRNYVQTMLARLVTEERVHVMQLEGQTVYAYGPGKRERQKSAETEGQAGRDDTAQLRADIVDSLSVSPASDNLLRERVGCASQSRWQRAIRELLYVRAIEGNASQYRLAGRAARSYAGSIDGQRRQRSAA